MTIVVGKNKHIFGGPLFAVLILCLLLRCFCLFQYDYPTGPDYGMHMFYAELFQKDGFPPATKPYFQLGKTEWLIMPGAPLIYMHMSWLSGRPIFGILAATAIWTIVEITGIYLLAWHLFKRLDGAIVASATIGCLPMYSIMMAGGGYPNISALALMPFAFLSWLMYWQRPNLRHLCTAVLIICGAVAMHHVSSIWIGLSLALFCLVNLVHQPTQSLRKILPIALIGIFVGAPILSSALAIFLQGNAIEILTKSNRFAPTRITWDSWMWIMSPIPISILITGTVAFLKLSIVHSASKLLIMCYLAVSLFFCFGWIVNIDFDYGRGLYFLGIPIALGAAAVIYFCGELTTRIIITIAIISTLGITTMLKSPQVANYNVILTHEVIEAANWIKSNTDPNDVVVSGTILGFHLSRLIKRPNLVSMSPELIGISSELPLAEEAMEVMQGNAAMKEIIDRNYVRYIIVRAFGFDIPDPALTKKVMGSAKYIRLAFSNSQVLIYQVVR